MYVCNYDVTDVAILAPNWGTIQLYLDAGSNAAYYSVMPKRSSTKKIADINLLAASVVARATEESAPAVKPEKNPAAVALGRLGGLKGGKARAEKLTAKKRSEIAKKAAEARWAKPVGQE